MDRISVDLSNCYGIKQLRYDFDFSKESAYAIYAPNGAMKSSLAQVFQDVADDRPSQDRIFAERTSSRAITEEQGQPIAKESVLVVGPYSDAFAHTEKTSTLLIDAKLKREYEELYKSIDLAKDALISTLKKQSGSKKDIEAEISSAFTSNDRSFDLALTRIEHEVKQLTDTPLADVDYDTIFNDKVLGFLETKDVKTAIQEYVKRYNELLAASTYFKKGIFDYYNAGQIAKTLASNGFFKAKHTVRLNAGTGAAKEITTQKELEELIAAEKEQILKDAALRKNFDSVQKLISANETLREFQKYLMDNEGVISQLTNVKQFKEDVWKSYLRVHLDLLNDLMGKLHAAEQRKKEIETEAAKQRTQWEDVIDIFNFRFIVPFELSVRNRTAVMLGDEQIMALDFIYHDGADKREIDRSSLLKSLSTGERKALYILHVIFDVEVRRKAKQDTIMVIDDVADSFDYQNKYAIIQYLKDINDDRLFRQIIMTHNFDFFRTINLRMVSYPRCLMAVKHSTGINLERASGIQNVFCNDWKKGFFTDEKKKVASIPFMRNLVEYTDGDGDAKFVKLTSLLHWKADSANISVGDLDAIYNQTFHDTGGSPNSTECVIDLIHRAASSCLTDGIGLNLENKIVLAIATRLAAEQFMVVKINDTAFTGAITANQTQALLKKYRETFGSTAASPVLDRVALMTPENIHLNSFMYEPIIDMADDHLRRLYSEVRALK